MIQELSTQLLALRQEIKEIEERQKEELTPKKDLMNAVQSKLIEELTSAGMKSIKTEYANFAITTRKGYTVVDEVHALPWAVENNVYGINARLLAQKLKDMEKDEQEIPDFFKPVETLSMTVTATKK